MKRIVSVIQTVFVLWVGVFCLATGAYGQELNTRFGLGFDGVLSTSEGVGIGMRARASAPLNMDLSLAVDLGVEGFFLSGRDDASYVFDPTVSAIVTLPGADSKAPYILAGLGAYVPLEADDDAASGPTIHGGIGWVRLLNETTVFYEIDPALIIGKNHVDLLLPFRLGVIF